ncbi:hypothetical protein OESDEN_21640 [Oesophagostomum dentatum]|uniref:SXP/RAL-2 family protein Ani s 5-like cation-binding domain-containing protein n=1 Tax=Oesophagostomum dentatum TaxID=61180 RepID=A0A0B1S5G0_OESDE|nr:hypothetical protein OESDEN_21640 [Oesophagostomum dentatum]
MKAAVLLLALFGVGLCYFEEGVQRPEIPIDKFVLPIDTRVVGSPDDELVKKVIELINDLPEAMRMFTAIMDDQEISIKDKFLAIDILRQADPDLFDALLAIIDLFKPKSKRYPHREVFPTPLGPAPFPRGRGGHGRRRKGPKPHRGPRDEFPRIPRHRRYRGRMVWRAGKI